MNPHKIGYIGTTKIRQVGIQIENDGDYWLQYFFTWWDDKK